MAYFKLLRHYSFYDMCYEVMSLDDSWKNERFAYIWKVDSLLLDWVVELRSKYLEALSSTEASFYSVSNMHETIEFLFLHL